MKPRVALLACIALLLSQVWMFAQNGKQPATLPAPAGAQKGPSDEVFTFDVTRVNLLFTVSDKKNRFVSNLTRDDFEIVENKKRQKILDFTAETDLPLR